jgi:hypothetical protein
MRSEVENAGRRFVVAFLLARAVAHRRLEETCPPGESRLPENDRHSPINRFPIASPAAFECSQGARRRPPVGGGHDETLPASSQRIRGALQNGRQSDH